MTAKPKKINLALQGGGSHGAFAWGIIDQLLQDGRIEIDSISATSAGAINAAVIAQGITMGGNEGARTSLLNFWRDISDYGKILSPFQKTTWEAFLGVPVGKCCSYFMFNMITELLSPYQFNPFNYNPLKYLLEKNVDFEAIKNTGKIKLFICATNVKSGKIRIFKNEELCTDVILASVCLPHLFQAVSINGEYYWDGGYMGNPAIFPLIYDSKVSDILIIHISPIEREDVPTSVREIWSRMQEISFNSSLMRELRAIAFITKLLDEKWIKDEYAKKMQRVYLHSIRSDKILMKYSLESKYDTSWDFITELFELGQKAGQVWLEEHYDKIGVQSSIDVSEFLIS